MQACTVYNEIAWSEISNICCFSIMKFLSAPKNNLKSHRFFKLSCYYFTVTQLWGIYFDFKMNNKILSNALIKYLNHFQPNSVFTD